MERMMIEMMLMQATGEAIEEIHNGNLTLEEDREILTTLLKANLAKHSQILSLLEAYAELLYKDTMEREYINQFLNRIRELANTYEKY